MLRFLFNEPRRQDSRELAAFHTAVDNFRKALSEGKPRVPVDASKLVRIELWCQAFVDALNEVEQSLFCANKYAGKINESYLESMSQDELDDYKRFVYFYKNGLIRMFSILDKLGYFMDELFDLQTERIKPKFSYFTVLRNMRQNRLHSHLEEQLSELKTDNRATMEKLRNQRNMEIHFINAEMLDELSDNNRRGGDKFEVEDVHKNAEDLKRGYDMVCLSLQIVFTYLARRR